jgi:hypothetical protein
MNFYYFSVKLSLKPRINFATSDVILFISSIDTSAAIQSYAPDEPVVDYELELGTAEDPKKQVDMVDLVDLGLEDILDSIVESKHEQPIAKPMSVDQGGVVHRIGQTGEYRLFDDKETV